MNVRKKMFNRFIAGCMVLFVAITAFPVNSYAKKPTLETPYKALTVGNTQLMISDYDKNEDTMLGCFVVPETGKYSITIANNGGVGIRAYLLDNNLSEIDSVDHLSIHTTKKEKFEDISLKKNQRLYLLIEIMPYNYGKQLVAAKVTIKQTDVKPTTKKPQ